MWRDLTAPPYEWKGNYAYLKGVRSLPILRIGLTSPCPLTPHDLHMSRYICLAPFPNENVDPKVYIPKPDSATTSSYNRPIIWGIPPCPLPKMQDWTQLLPHPRPLILGMPSPWGFNICSTPTQKCFPSAEDTKP